MKKLRLLNLLLIVSLLFITGCANNAALLGLMKTGALFSLFNDSHGSSSSSSNVVYGVDGYLGVVTETSNGAPSLAPLVGSDEVKVLLVPEDGSGTIEITVLNNHFSLGNISKKPGKMLIYQGSTLIGDVKVDNQTGSVNSEDTKTITYKVKLVIRKRNNTVTKVEYGALKVTERLDAIERCYMAGVADGIALATGNMSNSETKSISNISDENRDSVLKRITSEYQKLLSNTVESIKQILSDELNSLLVEVNALKETKKQLEQATEVEGLEKETILNLIASDDAVDSEFVFEYSGDAYWYSSAYTSFDGIACMMSGIISDKEESNITTTLKGPGRFAFVWKVSSEQNCDYLEFYINEELIEKISGKTEWVDKTVLLSEGENVIKFRYVKDNIGKSGLDTGMIDRLTFESGDFVTPVNSIEISSITSSTATVTWTAESSFTYNIYVDDKIINTEPLTEGTFNIISLKPSESYSVCVEKISDTQGISSYKSEQIFFTTKSGISIAEALDIEDDNSVVFNVDNYYVSTQNTITRDGIDAVKIIPSNTTTRSFDAAPVIHRDVAVSSNGSFNMTVFGKGVLSFYVKVNSEKIDNEVAFYTSASLSVKAPVKVARKDSYTNLISGYSDWKKIEIPLYEEINNISLYCLYKNNMMNVLRGAPGDIRYTGEDAVYIDQITINRTQKNYYSEIYKVSDITNEGFSLDIGYDGNIELDSGGYFNIYLNGEKKIQNITTDEYTVTGLNADTEYSVQVSSVDSEGYESSLSNPYNIITCGDVTINEALGLPDTVEVSFRYGAMAKVIQDSEAVDGYSVVFEKISPYNSNSYMTLGFDSNYIADVRYKVSNNSALGIEILDNSVYYSNGWQTVNNYLWSSLSVLFYSTSSDYVDSGLKIDSIDITKGSIYTHVYNINVEDMTDASFKVRFDRNNTDNVKVYLNDELYTSGNITEAVVTGVEPSNTYVIKIDPEYQGLSGRRESIKVKTLPEDETYATILNTGTSEVTVTSNGEMYWEKTENNTLKSSEPNFLSTYSSSHTNLLISCEGSGMLKFWMRIDQNANEYCRVSGPEYYDQIYGDREWREYTVNFAEHRVNTVDFYVRKIKGNLEPGFMEIKDVRFIKDNNEPLD